MLVINSKYLGMIFKITYLIVGMIVAAGLPLGMLKLAIYYSNKQNNDERSNRNIGTQRSSSDEKN